MGNMKKKIVLFLLAIVLIVPTAHVHASLDYYTSTMTFKKALKTRTVYHGRNGCIRIDTRTTSNLKKQAVSKYFYAYLFKEGFIIDRQIGGAKLCRDGYSSATWKNLKSDWYFFEITKDLDGCTVDGSIQVFYEK